MEEEERRRRGKGSVCVCVFKENFGLLLLETTGA